MHVLRPAEGGGDEVQPWEGVAGKMKQVEDRLTARLEGQTARLAAENAELKEKLSEMREAQQQQQEQMVAMQATLLKKMEEMAAPKSSRR